MKIVFFKTFYLSTFIVLGGFLGYQIATGQTVANKSIDSSESDSRFEVKDSITIGLHGIGFAKFYSFTNELGFQDDLTSMLYHDTVKQQAQITQEQSDTLAMIYADTRLVIDKKSSDPASMTPEGQNEIEAMFREMDQSLYEVLSEEQRQNIEIAKTQLLIQQYGLAKVLSTNAVQKSLGLEASEIDTISKLDKNFKSELRKTAKNLNHQANLALLEELTTEQTKNFNRFYEKKSLSKFLDTPLFTRKESLENAPPRNFYDLIAQTRKRSNRKKAGVSEELYEPVKLLKRKAKRLDDDQIKTKLNQILNTDQIDTFRELAIYEQTKALGTVNSISLGLLAEAIGLTDEEARSIFEFGKKLKSKMKEDFRKAQANMLGEALSELPGELPDAKREALIQWIGDVDLTK